MKMKTKTPLPIATLLAVPVFFLLSTAYTTAQTVQEMIEQAGLRDTIGTTVETSSDAGSQAFPELDPDIYWITKHTFIRATDSWNANQAQDADMKNRAPLIVSRTVMQLIRNEYLHSVKKLMPTLDRQNGYSKSEIDTLRGAIAPNLKQVREAGGKERLAELPYPNPFLAEKLKDYYDELFLEGVKEPVTVYSRLTRNLGRGGGAPIFGFSRDFGRLECTIADSATGSLVPAPEVQLTFEKKGLFTPANSTFYFNPATVLIPAGKWKLEIKSDGYKTTEKTIEIKKGQTLKQTLKLDSGQGSSTPTPTRTGRRAPASSDGRGSSAAGRVTPTIRTDYQENLGVDAVVTYDPRPALKRHALLPKSLRNYFKTYPLLNSVPTTAWHQVGRASTASSGVSGAPNPAINDPCLNLRVEEGELAIAYPNAQIKSFHRDIARSVVEWANAAYGDSGYAFERLGCFSINDRFFTRLEFRAQHENKTVQSSAPLGFSSGQMLPVRDYVEWDRKTYEKFRKSEATAGPIDTKIDLTIRFVKKFSIQVDEPNALAAYEANPTPGDPGGVIEIRCADTWSLKTGDGIVHGNQERTWPFLTAMLHELGHYFGLRHLPIPYKGHTFLNQCTMREACSHSSDFVTPIDAMLMRYFEYQPLQLRGHACGGLLAE